MAPGKDYLADLGGSRGSSSGVPLKKKLKKKPATKKNQTSPQKNMKKSTNNKTRRKRGIGQKAAVLTLIDSGFFNKGKTGPEVQTYLKTKRGLDFSTDQLRMAMLRLVREEKLDRDINKEGQYEYTKTKT